MIRGFMDIDTDIIQNIISTSQKQTFQVFLNVINFRHSEKLNHKYNVIQHKFKNIIKKYFISCK